MPKFPKLFALNVPLSVVRSSRKEYELKDGFFTPETYEDFYFFIRQGFLLEGDPSIKFNTDQKINFGMNDDDVMNEIAKRKGRKQEVIIDADFKDRCYSEFYSDIARKVEAGEMAAYPSDINERADAYYQEKLRELEASRETVADVNAATTIVETPAEETTPSVEGETNGPGPDADYTPEEGTTPSEEIIPTPENSEIFDENATIDDSATTTDEVEESLPTGEAVVNDVEEAQVKKKK